MKGGFSFCDTDIYDIGLEYVPENKETYVYKSASSNIEEENFNGHDGGYYYGSTLKQKEFSLKCFYEDKDIKYGFLTKVFDLFKVGRTGKLIFQQRPWCWYLATVTAIDDSSLLNYKNGIITITMKAYYPFARCDFNYYQSDKYVKQNILFNNTAILTKDKFPTTEITNTFSDTRSLLLYNGGTAKSDVVIKISGTAGEGILITNNTNNSECKIVAMSTAATSDIGNHILIDSLNGKTLIGDGTTYTYGFLYHDHGFIKLDPAYPICRRVSIKGESGDASVTYTYVKDITDQVGKYIWIGDKWSKITNIDNKQIEFSDALSEDIDTETEIVLMNEITITPSKGTEIHGISFTYLPSFY